MRGGNWRCGLRPPLTPTLSPQAGRGGRGSNAVALHARVRVLAHAAAIASAIAVAIFPLAAYACQAILDGAEATLESPRFRLSFRTEPRPVPIGEPFAIELVVCTVDKEVAAPEVIVDALMPAHRHGMNYRPTTTMTSAGRYRVEGFLFHMPGTWEIVFDVRASGQTDRLSRTVVIE